MPRQKKKRPSRKEKSLYDKRWRILLSVGLVAAGFMVIAFGVSLIPLPEKMPAWLVTNKDF